MKSDTAFGGFSKECVRFYTEIREHNSKVWFSEHEDEYREYVLEPARHFVVAMGERLIAIAPGIHADPRVDKSIFRIYRDTRFSRDKSPFKTHLGIWFWDGSGDRMGHSGFYFHLEPPNLMLAAGLYAFPQNVIEEYRRSVVDDKLGTALVKAVKAVTRHSGCQVGQAGLKRVPRGYDPEHKRAELLKHDTLYCWTETKIPKQIHSADAVDYCFDVFRNFLPLQKWLAQLVDRSNR